MLYVNGAPISFVVFLEYSSSIAAFMTCCYTDKSRRKNRGFYLKPFFCLPIFSAFESLSFVDNSL